MLVAYSIWFLSLISDLLFSVSFLQEGMGPTDFFPVEVPDLEFLLSGICRQTQEAISIRFGWLTPWRQLGDFALVCRSIRSFHHSLTRDSAPDWRPITTAPRFLYPGQRKSFVYVSLRRKSTAGIYRIVTHAETFVRIKVWESVRWGSDYGTRSDEIV